MIDNLFVVESPLQALMAVELSLRFKDKRNVIICRLADETRKRNNQQIVRVIENGIWSQIKEISFDSRNSLANHISIRKELRSVEKEFNQKVGQLFIGEFRSQWMHFIRVSVSPQKTILMDDGAATITIKRKFLDKEIYFPESLWRSNGTIQRFIKRNLYRRFLKKDILRNRIYLASAFFKSESLYPIDFSQLKQYFGSSKDSCINKRVLFFGSKYSESKIISLKYELAFIRHVKEYYSTYGCEFVYCAHRDESEEKLKIIKESIDISVITPELPAEILLLENSSGLVEVASAYSSVLNNVKVLMPEVKVRAFHLRPEEISLNYKEDVLLVYKHFECEGITVELHD